MARTFSDGHLKVLPACNFLSQYYFYNIFLHKSCRFSLQTLTKFEAAKTGSGVGFLRLTTVWLLYSCRLWGTIMYLYLTTLLGIGLKSWSWTTSFYQNISQERNRIIIVLNWRGFFENEDTNFVFSKDLMCKVLNHLCSKFRIRGSHYKLMFESSRFLSSLTLNNGNWTEWSQCNLVWNHTRDWNHKYDFRPKLHELKFNCHFITLSKRVKRLNPKV